MHALLFCLALATTCISISTFSLHFYVICLSLPHSFQRQLPGNRKGGKKKKCNHLTGYSSAEPQPQAGALTHYCCLQIHNSKKLQWWWAAQVQHLPLASTERKNNETFVPSSRSKAKTTAQQPLVFWMEANKMIFLLCFPQWVHKMFIRIIL